MPSITFWTRIEPYSRLDDIDDGTAGATARSAVAARAPVADGRVQAEDAGHAGAGAAAARALAARALPAGANGSRRSRTGPTSRSRRSSSASPSSAPATRAATCASPPRPASTSSKLLDALGRHGGRTAGVRRRADARARRASGRRRPRRRALPARHGRPRRRTGFASTRRCGRRYGRGRHAPKLPATPEACRRRPAEGARGARPRTWTGSTRATAPAGGERSVGAAAWISERMEYSFAVSARDRRRRSRACGARVSGRRARVVLVRRRPCLKLGVRPADPKPEPVVRTIIPAPVRYPGMAADRWWEFEDAG